MEPLRIGGLTVYPFGGLMALCAVAAFMCIAFSMKKKGLSRGTASWFAVLSVPLCFIFARLLYCLSMLDQIIGYDDYGMVFRFSEGGFMLWGAIVGGIIAAILTARITRQSAWTILDSSVVSACLLIAAGRLICGLLMKDVGTGMGLSDWFNTEWVDDPEMNRFSLFALEDYRFFERLPFAVKNFYDEWCWAVFVPECLWALITAVCVYRYKAEHGGKTLLFITMYSCGQILLESMLHGEVVYLPWLGFVKCNQVLCAVALLVVAIICLHRMPWEAQVRWSGRTAVQFFPAVMIIVAMEFAVIEKKISLIQSWPADVCHLIMAGACIWLGITVFMLIQARKKFF